MWWVLAACLCSVLVHEAGHAVAAEALGLPWKPTFSRRGLGITVGRDDLKLRPWQIRASCAAGPAANLAVAAAGVYFHEPALFLLNALFALINLIPLPKSDGARILRGQP